MGLTPNEILNKEFSTKFRGYDADQVNDYLDIVVADYERMIDEIHTLKVELAASKEKNEYFAQLQESLNSSIVVAQEAADRLKQNARKEAELIIFEAEKESDNIIGEATDRAKSIVTETEALRRSSKSYRERLEMMIRSQLDIVSGEEYKNLFNEEFESKLNPSDFREASVRASKKVDEIEQNNESVSEEIDNSEIITEASNDQIEIPLVEKNNSEAADYSNKVFDEPNQNDDVIQRIDDESEEIFTNAGKQFEEEPVSESVLGQTIRIELPKQID